MKIAVIVPAFNEEKSIASVVGDIQKVATENNFNIDIIVVNDCSIDATSEIISKLNCIAIHLPVNLGIGGAMQTGFKFAYENEYDFAIQIDGDGQHPANEIPKLLVAQKESNADVVIGSRFLNNKGFQSTTLRRTGINYFRILNKIFAGVDITDSTSGFRLLNKKTLEFVCEYYPDEYPEPEAIVLYAKKKLNIVEVSVEMMARQGGTSSIGFFSSIYYMWKVSLGIIFTFIRTK